MDNLEDASKEISALYLKTRRNETFLIQRREHCYRKWFEMIKKYGEHVDTCFGMPHGWAAGTNIDGSDYTNVYKNITIVERWVRLLRVWAEISEQRVASQLPGSHTKAVR